MRRHLIGGQAFAEANADSCGQDTLGFWDKVAELADGRNIAVEIEWGCLLNGARRTQPYSADYSVTAAHRSGDGNRCVIDAEYVEDSYDYDSTPVERGRIHALPGRVPG